MRIALDARTVYRRNRRGTGKNLIDLYRRVAALRPAWRVTGFHREASPDTNALPTPFAAERRIEMPGDRFDVWQRFRLPMAAWSDAADVLHCPANECPAFFTVPTLVTIHDLIPLDLPQGRDPASVQRFERSIRHACKHAHGIVCPSRYTAHRLVADFGANPDRITVNAWAPDSSMRRVDANEWLPVLNRYGVRTPMVIHFGSSEPRKNTARVLEAWARLDAGARKEWTLLVVGLDAPTIDTMNAFAKARGIDTSVRLHGFADERDIPTLLSAADVLAYPSLSEGFGLPVLDAWVAGAAVLTSDRTSLPEVTGDAGLSVDPSDTDAIAGALASLTRDASLRVELAQRGLRRLADYTWDATATRFIDAVERIAHARTASRRAA